MKKHEAYSKAHRLIAEIVGNIDMDDYPDTDPAVIEAIDQICSNHEKEADMLEEEINLRDIHSNLITPVVFDDI